MQVAHNDLFNKIIEMYANLRHRSSIICIKKHTRLWVNFKQTGTVFIMEKTWFRTVGNK